MDRNTKPTFSAERVRTQALHILRGWGMDGADAETTADVMLDTDLRGIDTHGISLLALYADWIKGGGYELAARAEVVGAGGTAVEDEIAHLPISPSAALTMRPNARTAAWPGPRRGVLPASCERCHATASSSVSSCGRGAKP